MTIKNNAAQAGQQGGNGKAEQHNYITGSSDCTHWQRGLSNASFCYRKHGSYHVPATARQKRRAMQAEIKRRMKKAEKRKVDVL